MNNKPVNMIAEIFDIAEHTNYLELVSRICYYDEPNLNGVMLPYDETSLEKANSLISMPVQAKYRVNKEGQPTLGGHEMIKRQDGSVEFRTQSIGVHTSVEIKNDNVLVNGEIKNLPCLFASYRIWKRYPNYIEAIKRLYDKGILYGSWEISTYQYVYDNGVRKVTDYEFIANCLLGETSYPSYGESAKALSMAEIENDDELMIAEALTQDLIYNNKNKEEFLNMAKENENIVVEETAEIAETSETVNENETVNDTSNDVSEMQKDVENVTEEKNTETTDSSQLTADDLLNKICKACRAKIGQWCYVAYFFPTEKEVWCRYENSKSELDYMRFTYEVDENDNVTVSEPEYVTLSVSIAEINSKINSYNEQIEKLNAELSVKNEAIAKANDTIQNLNVQISELKPFKEQVETAEQERIELEIAEEKKRLKNKLLKGNLFTESEIAEKDISDLIESRNESAINSLIADRFIASLDNTDNSNVVSETKAVENITASLESDEEDTNARSFMRNILFNK